MNKPHKIKQDIIFKMAKMFSISEQEASLFVNVFFDEIFNALLDKNRVEIRGFGVFKVKKYKAYSGTNPLNQAKISIKAKVRPKFKPGITLRTLVNQKTFKSPKKSTKKPQSRSV